MRRSRAGPFTIVIKLGTSSIVHETTHQPLLSLLSAIVETVVSLRKNGHKVVLVSSGAIGVGLKTMDLESRPKSLAGRQALAAIGQGRLIALWDNLFSQLGQRIAQVLLTRGDISDRTRYLNAANTFTELFSMGVVPIVNENDTVSVSEIRFGDNDTLSAITSAMIHADYLFLLTDVDGLYTCNPRKDPHAKPISVVTSISEIRNEVSTATLGSKLGTGGMETKMIAAEIATAAGVTTIITSSKIPQVVFDIIEYHILKSHSSPSSSDSSSSTTPLAIPIRPPHTIFTPSLQPLRDIKSWTFHTLTPSGSVIIDTGAHHVLSRRDSGGRLLAAGVIGVRGDFASGQAVRVVIRKNRCDGLDSRVDPHLHRLSFSNGSPMTQPDTPPLLPSRSTIDSISTLEDEGLGNSVLELLHVNTKLDAVRDVDATPMPSKDVPLPEIDSPTEKDDELEGYEIIEVGRGLANYNSAEIRRVRGIKSSQIARTLGYADSEYVVENITIKIPP